MSLLDLEKMSVETATEKEAMSRAIKAITMLTTRVMTVDACIDIMRQRKPFSGLDRVFERMLMHVQALTDDCLKVYEFCIADNVIACQEYEKDEHNDEDDLDDPLAEQVDVAAEPEEDYSRKAE